MKCEPHPSGYRCPLCFPETAGDWFDSAPIGDTDRCVDCGEPLCADHRFACTADRHEVVPPPHPAYPMFPDDGTVESLTSNP